MASYFGILGNQSSAPMGLPEVSCDKFGSKVTPGKITQGIIRWKRVPAAECPTRELDLFSFVPPVLPRRQPAPDKALVVLPFPDRADPPEPKPQEPTAAVELPASTPFRILDRHRLGQGSIAQKCRDNLTALALLKRLESEARPATHEERAVLVRYVGWGGLPQVFDERNPNWTRERTELRCLLSDDEFRSARASTLNAHYTAAPVIRAMFAVLERFGFAGGRVLEPACGLGHFLGLMPEGMRERSAFTGIEIDGLTVRLAKPLTSMNNYMRNPCTKSWKI